MSAEVFEKVKSIIIDQLGVDGSAIKPEVSFLNDLGADSLDIVELEEFGLEISDEDAEKILTVGDAVTYISSKA